MVNKTIMLDFKKRCNQLLEEAEFFNRNLQSLKLDIDEKDKNPPLNCYGLPVPQPDQLAFRKTLYKGFLKNPYRLENYVKTKSVTRDLDLDFLPSRLDIEPNSRCNFRCNMCQVNDWPGGKRAEDLSLKDFKTLIDLNTQLTEIKLQGLGEPLLHKNFIEMIEYAVKKDIWVRTSINGSLLHKKDNYSRLIDSGVSEILCSFDGTTKEVFEQIRKNACFEQIVNNYSVLNDYSEQKGVIKTRMWVVVQNKNKEQLFDFIVLAEKMKFKRLTFSLYLTGWGQEKWTNINNKQQASVLKIRSQCEDLLNEAKKRGISLSFWDISSRFSYKSKDTLCPWPFEFAYVASDKKIVPCCMISSPDVCTLGEGVDFKKIWNNSEYKEFRNKHIEGNLPTYCKICYDEKK